MLDNDFKNWISAIEAHPEAVFVDKRTWFQKIKDFFFGKSKINPNESWLSECWCPMTQAHSRVASNNLRKKYEDKILENLNSNPDKKRVTLFSGGSGGLFQDFVILLKLLKSGYKRVRLDCVEVNDNAHQQRILNAIVKRINECYNVEFVVNHYKSVENINAVHKHYDVAYWLDFDDIANGYGKDGSKRELPFRKLDSESNSIVKGLLWSFARLTKKGLFLLSFGKNMQMFAGSRSERVVDEAKQFEDYFNTEAYYNWFYINSNPLTMLIHLPFFIKRKKPIFINDDIVDDALKEIIINIINRYELNVQFISEKDFEKRFSEENKTVLVIDDTIFDPSKNETAVGRIPNGLAAQISRSDWNIKSQGCTLYPIFFELKKHI